MISRTTQSVSQLDPAMCMSSPPSATTTRLATRRSLSSAGVRDALYEHTMSVAQSSAVRRHALRCHASTPAADSALTTRGHPRSAA
jgi:hypothetical protein